MTRFYAFLLTLLCCSVALTAQSVVVPANLTTAGGFSFTDLDSYIDADTTATGERAHDTYLLEAGGIYFFTKVNRWTYDVTLRATGDIEALGRPLVDRRDPTGGSNRVDFYRGSGSFYWDGIYLIMGDEGPNAASYETAPFRPEGFKKTYSWNNCIIEKCRQGTIRSEGDSVKVFVTNSLIRNFGDYERQQGNGRIVDLRTNFGDTVVIKNNVIHNILDRIYIGFRQRGLNYFEFSRNTVFNHVGRHGFIQMRNTKETVIKDNFIQNPSIIGSSPFLANEQINFRNQKNFLFTLDTLVEGGSVTMLNNNIHYTDDVLNHYATFDSVTKPDYYSPVFLQALTNDVADADFEEVLELGAVPDRQPLIDYSREAILYKDSIGITNIMVEDSLFAVGTDYDRGYLFDFERFNPCYDPASVSATAATDGGSVGATSFCSELVNSVPEAYNTTLKLTAAPNPAREEVTFAYDLSVAGKVDLSVYNTNGALVANVVSAHQGAGLQRITWNGLNTLSAGMYFAYIRTPQGRMYVKIFKQ
ncbi:T9SS type A sorting domain-containing protein [Neolewinella lacunae]|uniref:T9SS type A sorting domain-containing protein n=1 Tax=Neolewinella lacunae TaxID=1517758 RepID=A0A923PQ04_9BACT|nr:T9SS type A sorting domain-containing protein [Neolewinella lacunae]MBC6994612.1 T9SS type A sorting domain-containing protein [Neolewinella lacunae]MDN3634484.1 T9SS type A sorting domain-containing protein [Neolewinella lacunae]